MTNPSSSFQRAAWQRLRKNTGALIGLIIIIISVVVAVFAYFIAPDSSPYANRIILEIGGNKPGFTQQFIKVKKERDVSEISFVSRLLHGKEDAFYYVPIASYANKGDSIIVQKYIDEGLSERQSFARKMLAAEPIEETKFLLGTDKFGRDILSRLVVGTRVSLSVGLITVIISLSIGLVLGSLAGYFRGRTDDIIMWFINIIWSIPTLLLVFAITLALGKGFWQV
ncbi:MAG: ABC transporter permease subunit, partial [Chitinophagaceae bacterium]